MLEQKVANVTFETSKIPGFESDLAFEWRAPHLVLCHMANSEYHSLPTEVFSLVDCDHVQ